MAPGRVPPGQDTATGTDADARYDRPGYEDKALGQAVNRDMETVDQLVVESGGDLAAAEARFKRESAGAPGLARQAPAGGRGTRPTAAPGKPSTGRGRPKRTGRTIRRLSRRATGVVRMTRRPGVLFDLDGTLVDTNYLHTLALSRAFEDAGEWAPMNAIHRLIGMGGDQFVPRLLGHESSPAMEARPGRYRELIRERVPSPRGRSARPCPPGRVGGRHRVVGAG